MDDIEGNKNLGAPGPEDRTGGELNDAGTAHCGGDAGEARFFDETEALAVRVPPELDTTSTEISLGRHALKCWPRETPVVLTLGGDDALELEDFALIALPRALVAHLDALLRSPPTRLLELMDYSDTADFAKRAIEERLVALGVTAGVDRSAAPEVVELAPVGGAVHE